LVVDFLGGDKWDEKCAQEDGSQAVAKVAHPEIFDINFILYCCPEVQQSHKRY
jgi:hypothetical protein